MPRNTAGTYSLVTGNPVTTGTTISSTIHNATNSDLALEITNSLSRDGYGAMRAPVKVPVGSSAAPAFTFSSDAASGLYLAGASDVRMSVASTDQQKWTPSAVTIYPATTIDDSLTVTGACTLSTTLGVTGATTLSSTLAVSGAATLSAALTVTGATTLNDPVAINAPLTVVSDSGRGITSTGAAGQEGIRAISGTTATASVARNALGIVGGYVGFDAVNPNSDVAFQNGFSPAHIPKAWGVFVTNGSGGVTVTQGLNIASAAIVSNQLVVTFASGFTSTPGAISWMTSTVGEMCHLASSTATTATITVSEANFGSATWQTVTLGSAARSIRLTFHGLQ